MKATLLKFTPIAFLTTLLLFVLAFVVGKGQSYTLQEVLGYLTIFTSLSLIFFALRHFRDRENNGVLTLGQGLTIGMIISAVAGAGSAIADGIYTTILYPEFIQDYTQHELDKLQASLPPAEFEVAKSNLLAQLEWMGTPVMLALIMFVTVVLIGFIVSLVATLLLRRKSAVNTVY